MTPQELGKLSYRVENFILLETGRQLPYVGLLYDPLAEQKGLAIFTNRRSNEEVRVMLEDALRALRESADRFQVMDGEIA
jgi:hypothetical protein